MTITEHANIQMTSALAAATAPAPVQKRKMYAHQLVNELEESEFCGWPEANCPRRVICVNTAGDAESLC